MLFFYSTNIQIHMTSLVPHALRNANLIMELRHLLRSISLEEILNCPFENDLQNSYSIHTINCPKNAPFVVFRSTQQQQQMDKKWRRYPSNNKWNFRLKSLIWINWFRIYFSCRPSEWPPVFWGHLLTSGQHGQPGRRHPARAEANLFKFISINLFSLASSFFPVILWRGYFYSRGIIFEICECPLMWLYVCVRVTAPKWQQNVKT